MAPLIPPDQPELTAGGINTVTPTAGQKKPRIAWVNQLGISTCIAYPCRGEYTHLGLPFRGSLSRPRSGNQGAIYSHHERIALITDRSGSRQIWVARAFRGALCGWAAWDQPARDPAIAPTLQLFHEARKLGVAVRVHHTCRPNRNVSQRSETYGDWVGSLHQALL